MATKANRLGDSHLTDPHFDTGPPKLTPILEHVYGSENQIEETANETKINEVEHENNMTPSDTNEAYHVGALVKDKRKQSIDMFRKLLADFKGNMTFPQGNRKNSKDKIKISDEEEKTKKDTKTADKGAETYSKLCKKYKKVPINPVMRQFGREVISLDGYDLSSKELKAFFVAILVGFWHILT